MCSRLHKMFGTATMRARPIALLCAALAAPAMAFHMPVKKTRPLTVTHGIPKMFRWLTDQRRSARHPTSYTDAC